MVADQIFFLSFAIAPEEISAMGISTIAIPWPRWNLTLTLLFPPDYLDFLLHSKMIKSRTVLDWSHLFSEW